ncbi:MULTISPECIES: 4-hydroxythreonine-4-phosphate dehydrogenase PdxA [unclassified Rhizobacter]|uniref:4-hydroxythreonine-4-phosphate dehydrogenase PdxA n=1 Tax=unclassified Rhizobacter TaxID=2640088 RepID=UPI0006FC1DE1|nr:MULTISPECIES: 4-hydroxythreonine-4-phosphate dehydrogenase PdxA [unclassified Rhizobacter]KQU71155.1 4-hydroxythreonine-4-phosphate dehydrogenase [Rhizobacter sp. Root29]KQV97160.1 4-hydroxythreonine-4-phosphate dehydrogenase [Rhizobacter sp. Root1238]KRB24232.1 4-hydroxythreonine-4-phosphate dehydrogenase [Rhizobacter sp. Root16D2]
MTTRAPIALTQGDACGIGPEIIAKLFRLPQAAGCFVIGDVAVQRRAVASTGGGLAVAVIERAADALEAPPGCIPVLLPPGLPADLMAAPIGQVDARAGAAAARCIEHAVRLARGAEIAAIVTAPIHKEALSAAGVAFPGHTEMLQALSVEAGAPLPPVRMMLANEELRTVLVTIHLSLRRAIDAVTFDAVLQTLRISQQAAARWGLSSPRIAVAGLNPHAGEGGLFGDEEIRIIRPAIDAARAEGIDASGPFAPDTVFMRARRGEFDLVIAMTHDHGLIPVKYLGVEQGVNVTLGLPFVRTSPDHGTAFDIAGTGRADASSLLAALQMARRLS